mgnify:FL=1
MRPDFLVDTDIFVDFLRGFDPAVKFVRENATRIALSAIGLGELYAGARDFEVHKLDVLPRLFHVKPITEEIAHMAGVLKIRHGSFTGLSMVDALIAATAKHYQLDLKTLRVNCFPMIPGLKPPYGKEGLSGKPK